MKTAQPQGFINAKAAGTQRQQTAARVLKTFMFIGPGIEFEHTCVSMTVHCDNLPLLTCIPSRLGSACEYTHVSMTVSRDGFLGAAFQ